MLNREKINLIQLSLRHLGYLHDKVEAGEWDDATQAAFMKAGGSSLPPVTMTDVPPRLVEVFGYLPASTPVAAQQPQSTIEAAVDVAFKADETTTTPTRSAEDNGYPAKKKRSD